MKTGGSKRPEPLLPALCAPSDEDAARILGIGITKLWELCHLPEEDPRRLRKNPLTGRFPIAELKRHLAVALPGIENYFD